MANAPSLTHAARHGTAGADPVALDASQITTGRLAVARLASGTATGSKFIRDDGTLAVPSGGSGSIIGLPTYAPGSLAGSFDTLRSLYLAPPASVSSGDVLSAVRAAVGRARAGLGYCHILAIGDSHTDGKMDDSSPPTGGQLSAWPEMLKARLVTAGVPDGGTGWVKFGGLLNPPDTRWTTTGTWGNRYGQAVWTWVVSTSTGATATLTLTGGGGTIVDILTTNNSKPFTYVIKNSGGTTISSGTITGDTTSSQKVTTVTGLTDAHDITLTTAAGTGGNWRLGAAQIRKASGLLVSNMAISNSYATGSFGWDKDPASGGAQYDWVMAECVTISGTPAVDLVTGQLGGNDYSIGSTSASAIATALGTIYGRFSGPSKLHVANWPGTFDQSTLDGAFYTLADTIGGGFVDTYRRAGNYTAMNARGGYNAGSSIHPNQAPHASLGTGIADLLLS